MDWVLNDGVTGYAAERTGVIIGAAIEVHRNLGAGLLESAYQRCLAHEFRLRGIRFESQIELPLIYKGCRLDCGYRIDFRVEDEIIVELKAHDHILPVHEAQLLTYMKLTNSPLGLLINFNVPLLTQGIRRLTL